MLREAVKRKGHGLLRLQEHFKHERAVEDDEGRGSWTGVGWKMVTES